MTPFAPLEKSASARSYEEVRQRRKNLKLMAGGLVGAIPGAAMGAATAFEVPSALGGKKDQKSVLVRALVGALIGGGVGVGSAALGNAISDYADLDPMVPTVGVEHRRMGKSAGAGSNIIKAILNFGRGALRAPGDMIESGAHLLHGTHMTPLPEALGRAGQAGNLAGMGAIGVGGATGLEQLRSKLFKQQKQQGNGGAQMSDKQHAIIEAARKHREKHPGSTNLF